jgi:hypothetical protein
LSDQAYTRTLNIIKHESRRDTNLDNDFDRVLDDKHGDLPGWLVQDETKVVLKEGQLADSEAGNTDLGEQAVRRVGCTRVVKDLIK